MGELLAFTAALAFSGQFILIRRGLLDDSSRTAWDVHLIVLAMGFAFLVAGLGVAAFFGYDIIGDFRQLTLLPVLLAVAEGILGPLSGLFLSTIAIGQIGASRSSALRASNSLFAAMLAIIFLGEKPGLLAILGMVIFVCGLALVSLRSEKEAVIVVSKSRLTGNLVALLAGFAFALSYVARGAALQYGATPSMVQLVGGFTATVVLLAVRCIQGRNFFFWRNIRRNSFIYYSLAGFSTYLARYAMLFSFLYAPVWLAVAIRNTQPLLVVLLSYVFLRNTESINLKIAGGTVLIMAGLWLMM